jgi:hypothetical protein
MHVHVWHGHVEDGSGHVLVACVREGSGNMVFGRV